MGNSSHVFILLVVAKSLKQEKSRHRLLNWSRPSSCVGSLNPGCSQTGKKYQITGTPFVQHNSAQYAIICNNALGRLPNKPLRAGNWNSSQRYAEWQIRSIRQVCMQIIFYKGDKNPDVSTFEQGVSVVFIVLQQKSKVLKPNGGLILWVCKFSSRSAYFGFIIFLVIFVVWNSFFCWVMSHFSTSFSA